MPRLSALTPHIRVLRALAVNLQHESDLAATKDFVAVTPVVRAIIYHQVRALDATADQLEAEEAELAQCLEPQPGDATYQPKGKR